MTRALLTTTLTAALAAFALPASAAAPSADDLLAHVPSSVMAVVVTDHARLSKHPHYQDILAFIASERHAAGLVTANDLGFEPGKDVTQAVGFRFTSGTEASLLGGPGLDEAAVRSAAEKRLAAGFATGEHAGGSWFTVATGLHATGAGAGTVAIGPPRAIERLLELASGTGKSVHKKSGWGSLSRAARKGKPIAWGVTWVPESDRKQLEDSGAGDVAKVERVTWRVTGAEDVTIDLVGYTASAEDADLVAAAIKGKIERKILGSAILKAVGVAALARSIVIATAGKNVTAHTQLTAAQVGSLTRAGKTVMKVLR